jgi:hypothetical protein
VGRENLDEPRPFSFAAAFDATLSAVVVREVFGPEEAPEPSAFVAADASAARFLGPSAAGGLELRTRAFEGSASSAGEISSAGAEGVRVAPGSGHARAEGDALTFTGARLSEGAWSWLWGQVSPSRPRLRVFDAGRFTGAPGNVLTRALVGGGATLATDLRNDADLGPLGTVEGQSDAGVLVLTRTPVP